MKNIKVLLPANLSFSAAVRDIAVEAANIANFLPKQKNMLRLVVDEIFMNAIRYGSDENSSIFVEGVINEEQIVFAIEDEGKGENKTNAEDLKKIIQGETENVSLKKQHGRGLAQITSTLVKAFEVYDKPDGGLRIEFVMERQEEKQEEKKPAPKKEEKLLPEETLTFSGVIDMTNIHDISEQTEQILKNNEGKPFRLIFDLSELEYCNSIFLGQIAAWQNKLEDMGGEVVVLNPTRPVFEIIDLVGLTQILTVQRDNAEDDHVAFERSHDLSQFKNID